jgi:PAS domain S-box-containing protein
MGERAEASGAAFWGDADETDALRRYQRLVNAVGHGIYQLDADGHFVAVNDDIVELTGYAREELLGEHVSEIVCDASPIEREMERLIETASEDGERVDLSVRTAEGDHVSCEVGMNPLVADDAVLGVAGTVRVLTEREGTQREAGNNRHERELRRYERIVENLPVGVYRNTPGLGGEFVEANSTLAEIFDADSKDELLGYKVRDLHPDPDRRAAFSRQLEQAGKVQDVELKQETIDGETIWISVTAVRTEEDGEDYFDGIVQDVTERKVRERELHEREQRLDRYKEYTDDILDAVDDVFYVVDRDGQFKRWNESLSEVTGYANEEIDGMRVSDFVDGETQEAAADALEEAFETGSINVQMELHTKEGNDIPFEFAASALEDPGGNRVLAGIGRDISERIDRQRTLEESERRYRTLVENFPNGAVGLFDEDLRYTVAGGEMLEEVGTSADEIVGQTVWERYPEDLAGRFETTFRAAFAGEANSFAVDFHGHHWRAHTLPVRDDEGDIFAGMVMVQDITEQIEREQALQESKNQLQALIELLPVAVFVAEADGRIVEWNEAAEDIWGGEVAESDSVREYEEYDGWWADTGEPVEPDEWPLARALRGEEVIDPEVIEIGGFDGERRTVLNHGMPVRDADGEVSRAVVTLIDITERKEYQRKLEESNERLEQFAYAASHDLQEPLRMVSSYLQLLETRYADQLDEEAAEFIDFAVDGAERMRNMIDGLLEYSRVDTRGDPFEAVTLDDVLADVCDDLQMRIEESGADITAESLPDVVGDPGQLRQLFQNLLNNAIKYSGEDPPEVHVSAEKKAERRNVANAAAEAPQNAEEWVISVSDEGVGIDSDDTDRVFEVFQRLHTFDEHSGTGIGLALCERIIDRHGGDIWVESELGEGATVSFTLPAAGDDDE